MVSFFYPGNAWCTYTSMWYVCLFIKLAICVRRTEYYHHAVELLSLLPTACSVLWYPDPRFESRCGQKVVFTKITYSLRYVTLGTGCTLTAVPRSTQPSTLRSASEMTYIVSSGALNSTHSLPPSEGW